MFMQIALAVLFSTAAKAEIVSIPLENIWGYHRNLRELEPEKFIKRDTPEKRAEYSTPEKLQEILDKAESSLTLPIEKAMREQVLNVKRDIVPPAWLPSPGFAVIGKERQALQGVHEVVVNNEKPKSRFHKSDQITVVFFALRARGLRLFDVVRAKDKITIRYGFISTGHVTSRWNLSLIPMGKLPAGEYEVEYVRSSMLEKKEQNKPELRRFGESVKNGQEAMISRNFKFTVSD